MILRLFLHYCLRMTHQNKQAKTMRVFHNKIKKILLRQNSLNVNLIYDIGVGRGGDIHKWNMCGINNAICYDINIQSIKEATDRFSKSLIHRDYQFYVFKSPSEFVEFVQVKSFLVSCQFAIHYFFRTENMINDFFTNVNKLLHVNGRFIGTFMNGDSVNELTNDLSKTYANDAFMMTPRKVEEGEYSRGIDVYLANTLYFGDKTVSMEYVVYQEVLEKKANMHGFELESFTDFADFYDDMNIYLDQNHKLCSFSYSTFVFKKINELA